MKNLTIKNIKMKSFALIIIALLMASIAVIAVPAATVKAATTPVLAPNQPVSGQGIPNGVTPDFQAPTKAYLSVTPPLLGVNQQLLVNMWLNPPLANNNRYLPAAYLVTITLPDGTTDVRTLDSYGADTTQWFIYVPTEVGNYTIQMKFLGTFFPAGAYYNGYVYTNATAPSGSTYIGSVYYEPSETPISTFTVQQNYVLPWPAAPLPTNYWTYPVTLENREWYPILGNYPGTGYEGDVNLAEWNALYPDTTTQWQPGSLFTPWVTGPTSAHILWYQQQAVAGLIGGPAGSSSTITGTVINPAVVYYGRCYATETVQFNGLPTSCAVCYDLKTGQQYYAIPTASGGVTPQYLVYEAPATATAGAPLEVGQTAADTYWTVELCAVSGNYLLKVNPMNGAITGNYSIAPGSGTITAPIFTNQMNGYCLSVQTLGTGATVTHWLLNWTMRGTSTTLAGRIITNTTYAQSSIGYTTPGLDVADNCYCITGTGSDIYPPGLDVRYGMNITVLNLDTGTVRFNVVLSAPDTIYESNVFCMDHGMLAMWSQNGYWVCISLVDGKVLWRSPTLDYPWGATGFGSYSVCDAYGLLYRSTYEGIVAYNWTNGAIVWEHPTPALANFESPYITNGTQQYPFQGTSWVMGGMLVCYNNEHTQSAPFSRGWAVYCMNATTGANVWNCTIDGTPGAMADGCMTVASQYDGRLYVYGQGLSSMTVSAPQTAVTQGDSVMITGTIMDQSPAQPNTPCVSDNSMANQMEYLHEQQSISGIWNNFTMTGVPVTLTAIGSNGNIIDIGTTTSNAYYGNFGISWTPPSADTYTISASFAGDASYSASSAGTTLLVSAATATPTPVATTAPINAATPNDIMTYIAVGVIAIIIAIAIVGALLYRKH